MSAPEKPWERPWSTDEIIENSENWTLAGDVALLNSLRSFAENLVKTSTEINDTLGNLTCGLDEASLKLDIARNEFQSLRNRQFIESRVYDEDETLSSVENVDAKKNKENCGEEVDRTEDIRLAALKGISALESFFDKVEVTVSDSEDDDMDLQNYILRPKDPYINRPLPYVIGSEDWHKTWHVGLLDSSSESETEKLSDGESDSESDSERPKNLPQIKTASDTSSELDFSNKIENSRPVLVQSKPDLFLSSDSDNSVPQASSLSNRNFAEQLAAKLGNVIKQEVSKEPEVNTRPLQKTQPVTDYVGIFYDEPPPLDDGRGSKGLFSGSGGLFDDEDDNEDEEFFTPADSKSLDAEKLPPRSKIESGLFDGASSDEDIFSSGSSGNKKSILPPFGVNVKPPLFDEEPPVLEKKEQKKPVGGVSIFGGADLFGKKLPKRQPSSSDDESDQNKKESQTNRTNKTEQKKVDLFNDDSDPEDLFNPKPAPRTSKKENPSKLDLFADLEPKIVEQTNKQVGLFDDDDDALFKDDLFSTATPQKFKASLFDDDNDVTETKSKQNRTNLFVPDNKNSINVDSSTETKERVEKKKPTLSLFSSEKKLSLFDSPSPEPDDLFEETNDIIKTIEQGDNQGIGKSILTDDLFKTVTDTPPEDDLFKPTNESVVKTNAKSDMKDDLFKTDTNRPLDDDLFKSANRNIGKSSELTDDLFKTIIDTPPEDDLFKITNDSVDKSSLKSELNDDLFKTESNQPLDDDLFKSPNHNELTDDLSKTITNTPPEDDLFKTTNEDTVKSNPKSKLTDDLFKTPLDERLFESTNPTVSKSNKVEDDLFVAPKANPPISLFDDTPPPIDQWDSKSDTMSLDFDNDLDDDSANQKASCLFDDEPPLFEEKNIKKVSDMTQKFEKTLVSDEVFGNKPKTSPGKLRHNLNINVGALVPGFVPPKRGAVEEVENKVEKSVSFEEVEVVLEKTSVDTTDNVEVLHSVTKDRARVPFQRRPSTRRGRKAALKNLDPDFKLDVEKSEEAVAKVTTTDSQENKNDVFESSSSQLQEVKETQPEDVKVTKKDDLFGSPSSQPKETKAAKDKSDLFADSSDDDDLFSGKKAGQPTKVTKKSLFGDDDDDIFKTGFTTGTAIKKPETRVAAEKKLAKISVKKLKNTKPDDDPLSALLK